MIGAPNSLNLNGKVRVMKEAPGPSVSKEIADIFTNYDIDAYAQHNMNRQCLWCLREINKINELSNFDIFAKSFI